MLTQSACSKTKPSTTAGMTSEPALEHQSVQNRTTRTNNTN